MRAKMRVLMKIWIEFRFVLVRLLLCVREDMPECLYTRIHVVCTSSRMVAQKLWRRGVRRDKSVNWWQEGSFSFQLFHFASGKKRLRDTLDPLVAGWVGVEACVDEGIAENTHIRKKQQQQQTQK